MATIDLGKLGFVNKGTYSSSTSYEKNDLVQYTDSGILSTYLYINSTAATGQTPSTSGTVNGTYWAYYAKGGSTYTSTLTTQGDILYHNGSGEARLGAGTSGQVLQTGGSGANPSWGTVSSDFVKLAGGSHSGATNLVIDNLDVTSYNTFRIHLQNCLTQTSNTQTLFLRFRYNNSGTQTTYSVAAHTYIMKGRYAKGGNGDTGESSGTSEESSIRLNWALSKNTDDRYSQSFELMISELNNTSHHKDVRIMSYGTYYNNTEYSMYNFGAGICRQATQVFNGFDIYAAENWKCDYQIYGIK